MAAEGLFYGGGKVALGGAKVEQHECLIFALFGSPRRLYALLSLSSFLWSDEKLEFDGDIDREVLGSKELMVELLCILLYFGEGMKDDIYRHGLERLWVGEV